MCGEGRVACRPALSAGFNSKAEAVSYPTKTESQTHPALLRSKTGYLKFQEIKRHWVTGLSGRNRISNEGRNGLLERKVE
ncbi:hypothetical protein EVAR_48255_1 [Eumeta japonica]|uniref:Uncharacterized protein n=1 Tax=Eumeta variegata TaxID=151549 RepID=A0A4C1YIP9_EUMVA|nr:hypothetical protein EVAR_48255_1 [Eumeta japonica]